MTDLYKNIKELREEKGLSQDELAKMTGYTNRSSITKIEKGEVDLPRSKILAFAQALGTSPGKLTGWEDIPLPDDLPKVSAEEAFGGANAYRIPTQLIPSELEMLEKYRNLDSYGQETVSYILDRETKRVSASQDKDSRISELESILRQSKTTLRIYTYMQKIASAGKGFYFDDIPTDTIEAPYMEGADFIIGVSGDSMEPTYKDGDLVYVQKQQIVHTGEIGIFMLNNEWFIKEAGEEGLVSHNKKYPPITGTPDIQCIGRVLGKVENN